VSAKKHKSDYFILGILGLLTASVLILLVIVDMVRQDRSESLGSRTTYSPNINGTIVPYTLFERLGISVTRSEKVLMRDVFDSADVLFQLDPVISMHADETEDMRAWLISGGVFICTEIPVDFANDLRSLGRNRIRFGRFGPMQRRSNQIESSELTSIPVEHNRLPLARDVSEISFDTSEVLRIDVTDSNKPSSSIEPLLVDDHGVRIATQKFGRGRFIVLSDSSFLANGKIGKNDNSILATNLVYYALSEAGGTKVVFDEYHQDPSHHTGGFNVLSKSLFTSPAGWAVLSLTVAGVLYLIYKGRRFGSRRDIKKKQLRSKLDYVYSVGATYRAAGANRLVLELVHDWLKRRMTGLAGLVHNASNETIASELSRRTDADRRRYKEILDQCDRLLAQKRLSQRDLLLAIKQLARIEMEVFNEYRSRK
jgi:hypothetical protein